ncbi:hypothetical protein BC833DRAFT_595371, partial [Globomyces pollinis-pini]
MMSRFEPTKKMVRNTSNTRGNGGLTPLTNDVLDSSTSLVEGSTPDSNSQRQNNDAICSNSTVFLSDMIKRTQNLKSMESDFQVKRLKSAVESSNTSIIHSELELLDPDEKKETPEEARIRQKILSGLLKIKQFDELINQKTKVARHIKKERIQRESQRGTPELKAMYHNTLSDDDEDLDALELRSVDSAELITFLTEPKFNRIKIGKEAMLNCSTRIRRTSPKKVDYKQGDFISRNIVLGGDARFYHALTQNEIERINRILDNDSLENDSDGIYPDDKQVVQHPFTPNFEDLHKLVKIDSKLSELLPESEWDNKSLVWSASGYQTPIKSWPPTPNIAWKSKSRDIETAMNDKDLFNKSFNERRIDEIDQRLMELQNIPDDQQPCEEKIQELLHSIRSQITEPFCQEE